MKMIRDVIAEKSLKELITVDPSVPILEAAELMTRWNVGSLLVMKDGLVGILSERDCVRCIASRRPLESTRVEDVMSRVVRVVPGDLGTDECMALMTMMRVRHLPVVDGGQVLGVASIGDLVKEVISDRTFVIEQLEAYITRAANA